MNAPSISSCCYNDHLNQHLIHAQLYRSYLAEWGDRRRRRGVSGRVLVEALSVAVTSDQDDAENLGVS
jgi:hypothetical protein